MRLPLSYIIATLIATTIYVHDCKCQPYYFRHYQVENGLSNNTIHCTIQDKNGFMWFGTKEGLNRFDGYSFKHFGFDESNSQHPADNRVFSLFIDPKGQLWVGSRKGLYQFDEYKEKLVRFTDSPDEIVAIQTDSKGQLWFISNDIIHRYNFSTKKITPYTTNKTFQATSICKAADGSLWFSGNAGFIFNYLPESDSFKRFDMFAHSPAPNSRWIVKLVSAGKDKLLVGTSTQGIKTFNIVTGEYEEVISRTDNNITIFVRDILNAGNNEFWIGTETGIIIYNSEKNTFINLQKKLLDPYSISDNAIYALCMDREGGIWAGTYFGGVNYYAKQYALFHKYFPDLSTNSISGSAVREICADNNGNLWIGTEDAGLNKLDTTTGAFTHFQPSADKHSIAYSNIHGLAVDDNELWIGTFEHGLDKMDIRTGRVIKNYLYGASDNQLKSNFPVSIIKTKAGNIYASTSNGVFLYRKSTDDFQKLNPILDWTFDACLLEDHSGRIWVGTYGRGAYYNNPKTKQDGFFTIKDGLTNENVTAIMEDAKRNIWLATEGGGICVLDTNMQLLKVYSTKTGLPSNYVFKTIEDDYGNVWISTSKGLAKLNLGANQITSFTKANGLLNDQFNYNSGYKAANGKIYFGSIKGMISFNPLDFTRKRFSPPVFITGFQIHNKEISIDTDSSYLKESIIHTKQISLPYDEATFSIDFAALSYMAPEKTEYRYKLDGLESEWTTISTNRKVYFTAVNPGSYHFLVQASNDGNWNQPPTTLEITILPPFWKTNWAYALYIILGLGLIYYLFRQYHNRTQERKEKEIYEAKIDFFTNVAHEIKTPLTLIKGPLENLSDQNIPEIKEEVMTMERNTNRLVTLVQQILDFRQTELKRFSLDFEDVSITEITQEVFVFFQPLAKKRKLDYQLILPDKYCTIQADGEALNKIFSNLFGNAVKYAATKATVELLPFTALSTECIVTVATDGAKIQDDMREKIFEPFFRLKENHKEKGTGIGLALARSLTELHGGQLYLDNRAGDLNVFVLRIPLNKQPN